MSILQSFQTFDQISHNYTPYLSELDFWHLYLVELNIPFFQVWNKLDLDKLKFQVQIKPNYFKKHSFSSSFLLAWSKYTVPKWPWSTRQTSSMHCTLSTSLLSTPLPFLPVYLLQVSKIMMENVGSWYNLALDKGMLSL